MGCRLPKLRRAEERRSPGKIYSTLRRPQVETKVGVAYTYHFLDFLLGKEEVPVSSVLCLSSVRELPVQVRELYAQGFVLVAVHPFVHPCGPRHARIQHQLHRAVLVRETPSSEKSQLRWMGRRLETDVCVAGHQAPDLEVIQNYVKRIQDVAEQGVMFVGFLQQPGGGPCFLGHWELEELSSLHSSPSPIHRHPFSTSASPTDPAEPHRNDTEPDYHIFEPQDLDHDREELTVQDHEPAASREPDFSPLKPVQNLENHTPIQTSDISLKEPTESTNKPQDHSKRGADTVQWYDSQNPQEVEAGQLCPSPPCVVRQQRCSLPEASKTKPELKEATGRPFSLDANLHNEKDRQGMSSGSCAGSPEPDHSQGTESNGSYPDRQARATTHNNNHIRVKSSEKERKAATSPPAQARMQLFALYNHTGELNSSLRFYALRVPLRVQKEAGLTTEVDAHWLDHMTQHFTNGAHLIDGFFHLGDDNDNGISSADSVFIFQSSAEDTANISYDAIVVEQWTVVDGVVVRTDYIPLLQSLAPYGWRLMCVLPTPIVKTNSDGSLSTKQILFLQRPVLQRKRKDFKMLNLRGRNKAKKNSAGETPEKERENTSPVMEREMERLGRNTKEQEDEEEREERRNGDKGEGESPQRGGEERRGEAHQKGFSLRTEGGASDENQEEETEIDQIPSAKQEKTVRWTDVFQRDGGGMKEEVKTEERIKQQLSERALFSGVC
ncbi:raftlin isoform X2 [Myripristis murdjan]|nr:raftlin-like isoform X2 [Myripristis murdjan]XP_029919982.1 raftlin-like isoform X2 [Myripristis murdjan]XP_029919983.1 raftlin-like isoform X2 [Myripristis murdjan]